MYHPYKNGYQTFPEMKELGKGKVFQISPKDYEFFLEEKQKACENQLCFVEHNMSQEIYDDVCQFIVETYPAQLEEPFTFDNIALQIQEDLAIHRMDDENDWLAAAFVCFPTKWRPEDKIGLSFRSMHDPVLPITYEKSRSLIEEIIDDGPFVRYFWTPVFDLDQINYHPSIPSKKFIRNDPCIHCKVERQVLVGFPKHRAFLIVMRQWIVPQEELDLTAMYDAINDLGTENEKHCGIFTEFYQIKEYLKKEANIPVGLCTSTKPNTNQSQLALPAPPKKDYSKNKADIDPDEYDFYGHWFTQGIS